MSKAPLLSVVIPVYNEEEVLPHMYARLTEVLEKLDESYEILLVNDGSRDRSLEIMVELRERDPRVTLVNLARNFGHQLAVTAGLDHARGQAVVIIDADLQDPPEVIPAMLERWREGYDVVYGQRVARAGESLFKKLTAAAFYRFLRRMTSVDIPVDTGDFRLLSRRVVDAMSRLGEHHRFLRGMIAWLGFRQVALQYERAPRFAGETKYPLRKMLRFAADATVSFSFLPLRAATALGFLVAAACLIYAGYAVWARLFAGVTVSGWTSLMVAVLFLGAVQLLSLGVIGEYLGRVYEEVKGRPLYVTDFVAQGTDGRAPAAPGAPPPGGKPPAAR
ncbi:MAG: glycosyltransferase family 2 protein [Acidobacteriota bacterium]|nr:glycosyltransferase family 2 protein [Acidobacteriota bacterium]